MSKKDQTENIKDKKIEAISQSGLSDEAKKAGIMATIAGVSSDSVIRAMVSAEDAQASKKASEEAPKQKEFADYTPVERQIAKMLTEDTGIAMGDSGGVNGRAWQINGQVKDFKTRPAVVVDTYLSDEEKRKERNEDRERLKA